MRWRKITLIGVGLLGGSLGLAVKQRGLAEQVAGYVRRKESVSECLEKKVVDEATTDLKSAAKDADLVVFCTPLAQMGRLAREIAPVLKKGALVTDVGSVKGSLTARLQEIFERWEIEFVGSHPMAGSEKMGVQAARPELFENAVCVITPTSVNTDAGIQKIERLWSEVGGRVMRLSPEDHDRFASRSSHLPHLLAAALARYVLQERDGEAQQKLCANGFKDTTRVASGSPEMWRDIVTANRAQLLEALHEFVGDLRDFAGLLEKNDLEGIENFFREAKTRRDGWASQCASPSPE